MQKLMLLTLFLGLRLSTSLLGAQSPAQPSFEVASVRAVPANRSGPTETGPLDTNLFHVSNATLEYLIQVAYGVNDNEISHKPGWLGEQEYDITARAAENQKLSYEQLKPALQHLLEERFHLKFHREAKAIQGFALTIGKGGPTLTSSKGGAPGIAIMSNSINARRVTMAQFAAMLWTPTGRPVLDETHLSAEYDISLRFTPLQSRPDAEGDRPSLSSAIKNDLGLKLVPQKIPVSLFVIDHADRMPLVD